MKQLGQALVGGYQISPAKTRLSLITFGDSVKQALTFADSPDIQSVERGFNQLDLDRRGRVPGELNWKMFSKYADSSLFSAQSGSRAYVRKVVVIFTLKASSLPSEKNKEQELLKDTLLAKGIKLVVINIDNNVDINDAITPNGLKPIGGDDPKYFIPVQNSGLLMENFGFIEKKIADSLGKSTSSFTH